MKFVHTADWQLGKPFGRFEPEVRTAPADARFASVDAIGAFAANNGANHVLVAGDVFHTDRPEDRTIVQGRPVSLILDDPLVYSDDARLDLIVEILCEAAERMQVILLTCRERAFRHVPGHRLSLTAAA